MDRLKSRINEHIRKKRNIILIEVEERKSISIKTQINI